jgi:hypothetical protein
MSRPPSVSPPPPTDTDLTVCSLLSPLSHSLQVHVKGFEAGTSEEMLRQYFLEQGLPVVAVDLKAHTKSSPVCLTDSFRRGSFAFVRFTTSQAATAALALSSDALTISRSIGHARHC